MGTAYFDSRCLGYHQCDSKQLQYGEESAVDGPDLFATGTRLYYLANCRTKVSKVKMKFAQADDDFGNVFTDAHVIPLR